jgi:hypothetical protein
MAGPGGEEVEGSARRAITVAREHFRSCQGKPAGRLKVTAFFCRGRRLGRGSSLASDE